MNFRTVIAGTILLTVPLFAGAQTALPSGTYTYDKASAKQKAKSLLNETGSTLTVNKNKKTGQKSATLVVPPQNMNGANIASPRAAQAPLTLDANTKRHQWDALKVTGGNVRTLSGNGGVRRRASSFGNSQVLSFPKPNTQAAPARSRRRWR